MEVEQEPEIPPMPEGAWHVHARWLLDLEEFNEWMNEEDYLYISESVSALTLLKQLVLKYTRPMCS